MITHCLPLIDGPYGSEKFRKNYHIELDLPPLTPLAPIATKNGANGNTLSV
jgi:hypothetical protein